MNSCRPSGLRLVSAPINSRLNVVVQSPIQFRFGRNGCWLSRGSQLPQALPSLKLFFAVLPLNDRRRAAHSFFEIGRVSSFCLSLARLRLLILLLMSGNVHPNPDPVIPCSVCAGNVSWRGRSVQCCTCSNDSTSSTHCSLSLDSELLAALTPGAAPCFFWRSHTYQHCNFLLGLLQLVYFHCSIWLPL